MTDAENSTTQGPETALKYAHIVYGLHAFAIVLGILGSPTVIGGFIGSVPSIIAVIINYLKRGDAQGSWIASHFRWQIRTFWFALMWVGITLVLMVSMVGVPIGLMVLLVLTLWLIYRIGRGWMRLADRQAMYS